MFLTHENLSCYRFILLKVKLKTECLRKAPHAALFTTSDSATNRIK